jgi:hypothetical protein
MWVMAFDQGEAGTCPALDGPRERGPQAETHAPVFAATSLVTHRLERREGRQLERVPKQPERMDLWVEVVGRA